MNWFYAFISKFLLIYFIIFKTFIKMPSIFLFTPLYSTTGDCTYGIDTLLLSFHHIFEQCVYLEILLYIFSFNLYFHRKFGLKFNLEEVLKSLTFFVYTCSHPATGLPIK